MSSGNDKAFVACIAVLFALIALGSIWAFSSMPSASADAPPAPFSKARIAQCSDVLDRGMRAGLIRERPSAIRIDVEDSAWHAASAGAKRGYILALGCEAYGRPMGTDYVVVYGYRSGKRLAMATGYGVNFE